MRLIDADRLIDYFYYGENDKAIIDGAADRKIIEVINAQPTAYDIDEVVEQLERERKRTTLALVSAGIKKAIEIVKGGGSDD